MKVACAGSTATATATATAYATATVNTTTTTLNTSSLFRTLAPLLGEEVQAMVVNKKTWTSTHTSTDKDGHTSTSTTTHYRMTVKYVVANGDTVTKELIPTAKQYSNHFEGNNAAMIYLR